MKSPTTKLDDRHGMLTRKAAARLDEAAALLHQAQLALGDYRLDAAENLTDRARQKLHHALSQFSNAKYFGDAR